MEIPIGLRPVQVVLFVAFGIGANAHIPHFPFFIYVCGQCIPNLCLLQIDNPLLGSSHDALRR